MVTESLMTTTNSQWVEATDRAVLQLHQELSRVCVVKGVESHETIATAMVHEPFRANMDPQTHILYKWICLCDVCLSKGFCGHCFFAEHNMDSIYPPHTLTQRIVDPYRVWMLHIEVLLDGDVQR